MTITSAATSYTLWWTSTDRQGVMNMGEYKSEADAREAIPAMRQWLIDECAGGDIEFDEGIWDVEPTDD